MTDIFRLFLTLLTWLEQTGRARDDNQLARPTDRHEWARGL